MPQGPSTTSLNSSQKERAESEKAKSGAQPGAGGAGAGLDAGESKRVDENAYLHFIS